MPFASLSSITLTGAEGKTRGNERQETSDRRRTALGPMLYTLSATESQSHMYSKESFSLIRTPLKLHELSRPHVSTI